MDKVQLKPVSFKDPTVDTSWEYPAHDVFSQCQLPRHFSLARVQRIKESAKIFTPDTKVNKKLKTKKAPNKNTPPKLYTFLSVLSHASSEINFL